MVSTLASNSRKGEQASFPRAPPRAVRVLRACVRASCVHMCAVVRATLQFAHDRRATGRQRSLSTNSAVVPRTRSELNPPGTGVSPGRIPPSAFPALPALPHQPNPSPHSLLGAALFLTTLVIVMLLGTRSPVSPPHTSILPSLIFTRSLLPLSTPPLSLSLCVSLCLSLSRQRFSLASVRAREGETCCVKTSCWCFCYRHCFPLL